MEPEKVTLSPEELKLRQIAFIDIETVPRAGDLEEYEELYHKKFKREIEQSYGDKPFPIESHFADNAGLFAEFGKIVNISVGKMGKTKLFVKSIAYEDEEKILRIFMDTLEKMSCPRLCAHNGLDFDFPYITRRILINGMKLPSILNTNGKKPWELPYDDTMVMWGGTQFKYRCSLDLLTKLFGLPSPKQSMTGKDVATLFYNEEIPLEERLKRISDYGSGDIVSLVNVWCKMMGISTIAPENIEYVRA